MFINKQNISLKEAMLFSDYDKLLLSRRENGLLLSDYQISILNRSGIDYSKFFNFRDLLFEIQLCLDDFYDEELDLVSSQISEFIYYNDTNK